MPDPEQADTRPEPPVFEQHHRDVKAGSARAAVFGVSDGLVSNTGLILAMAGADPGADVVRLAGLSGLIAGAISMAAGEYNSMRVQAELLEHELSLERTELARNPQVETVELTQIYQSRGMEPDTARELAEAMMADPELALEAHAREELGIDPSDLGSPVRAALSSFVAFSVGAVIPLVPWFFADGRAAVAMALALSVVAAIVVGWTTARMTDRPALRVAGRQLAFVLGPAFLAYAIGAAVGVSV